MGHGDYRKLNDGSMNSSTYHKRDGTAARQKLKVEAKREVKAEGVQDVGEWQGHPVIGASQAEQGLKTPETDPRHHTVGRLWVGFGGGVYYCDSYDPRIGYWMTNIADSKDRRNVSERAPHRTFHPITNHWQKGELREGVPYFSVDLLAPVAEVKPITYVQAKDAALHVAIFSDEWDATLACRRADERRASAAKARGATAA